MAVKRTSVESYEIIRRTMRKQNLTYNDIAHQIGERPDKLSIAVKCTSGVGPKAIALRAKISAFLNLDPSDVWDAAFMTSRSYGERTGGKIALQPASELTAQEWDLLTPSERVRALLLDNQTTLAAMAEALGLNYKTMTKAIYGISIGDETRQLVASFLKVETATIWPDLYGVAPEKISRLTADDLLNPWIARLVGLGDMTVKCLPARRSPPANP